MKKIIKILTIIILVEESTSNNINGGHITEYAESLGLGSTNYELIEI